MNQIYLKLEEIENGTTLCIDANIFVYHFLGMSHSCHDLLKRCASRFVQGVTSITVLHEVTHRLMVSEALEKGFISRLKPVQQLDENPEIVKRLHLYRERTLAILAMGIEVAPIVSRDIVRGLELSKSYGLLTLDSILLAVMERLGISHIVTADKAFSNIQGINHYSPTDIRVSQ